MLGARMSGGGEGVSSDRALPEVSDSLLRKLPPVPGVACSRPIALVELVTEVDDPWLRFVDCSSFWAVLGLLTTFLVGRTTRRRFLSGRFEWSRGGPFIPLFVPLLVVAAVAADAEEEPFNQIVVKELRKDIQRVRINSYEAARSLSRVLLTCIFCCKRRKSFSCCPARAARRGVLFLLLLVLLSRGCRRVVVMSLVVVVVASARLPFGAELWRSAAAALPLAFMVAVLILFEISVKRF